MRVFFLFRLGDACGSISTCRSGDTWLFSVCNLVMLVGLCIFLDLVTHVDLFVYFSLVADVGLFLFLNFD